MLVFVDESGDVGLKEASSQYFHIVLVVFPDNDDALRCDKRMDAVRNDLGFPPDVELKFNRLSRENRLAILKKVAEDNWFFYAITINKAKLRGKGFQFPSSFYKYCSRLVFLNAASSLLNATVVIDGRGSKKFRRELASYLRKQINTGGGRNIRTVKLQDSRRNNLLQLADLVAGAVGRYYQVHKNDHREYLDVIYHRCVNHQFWPK